MASRAVHCHSLSQGQRAGLCWAPDPHASHWGPAPALPLPWCWVASGSLSLAASHPGRSPLPRPSLLGRLGTSWSPPPPHRGRTFGLNHSPMFFRWWGVVSLVAAGPELSSQAEGKQPVTQAGHVTAGGRRGAYHLGWGLLQLPLQAEAQAPPAPPLPAPCLQPSPAAWPWLRASQHCHCGQGHPVSLAPEQTQGRDPGTRSWQVGAAPIALPPSLPLGLSPSQVTITAFYVRTLYKLVVYFIF